MLRNKGVAEGRRPSPTKEPYSKEEFRDAPSHPLPHRILLRARRRFRRLHGELPELHGVARGAWRELSLIHILLVQSGIITEQQLIEALKIQLGVEFVDLTAVSIPVALAKYVTRTLAKHY